MQTKGQTQRKGEHASKIRREERRREGDGGEKEMEQSNVVKGDKRERQKQIL